MGKLAEIPLRHRQGDVALEVTPGPQQGASCGAGGIKVPAEQGQSPPSVSDRRENLQ